VTRFRAMCAAILASLCSSPVDAQSRHALETSRYWCDVLKGSYDGRACMAPYETRRGGACQMFTDMNVSDPDLLARLSQVRNARVCLSDVTDEAKAQTLKMRVILRGFVTAGQDENVNDPVRNRSFRPAPGKATYAPAIAYFLYECVVETCEAK
jgi:hypothetical protein